MSVLAMIRREEQKRKWVMVCNEMNDVIGFVEYLYLVAGQQL